MREKSQPFVQRLNIRVHQKIPLKSKFRDGIGDTIVETPIERSKLVYFDRSAMFECEIGYCLTQIAVVVNNLVKCEPSPGQLPPVSLQLRLSPTWPVRPRLGPTPCGFAWARMFVRRGAF